MPASDMICFSGLVGESGSYGIPPRDLGSLAPLLKSARPRPAPKILKAGLDPEALDQAGWAVVWPEGLQAEIRAALAPLRARRRRVAGPLFRELEYYSGDSLFDFLESYSAGPDSVDPRKVPYHLLIVGSPQEISFDLQAELAVSRSVGRLDFPTPRGYADYAERLVQHEEQSAPSPTTMAFLGVENPDDPLTSSAVESFIKPLEQKVVERRRGWRLETILRHAASKSRLQQLFAGEGARSVLFTASHAVRFLAGSSRQRTHQGSLVCADWPGPVEWQGRGAMLDEHLFSASDLAESADLSGLVAFLFGCYTAGTPELDPYATESPRALAPAPFVSPLPQALLQRGALAVIGHVDLTLEQSFVWSDAGPQLEVFDSILYEITAGKPVGHAMRHLGQRHAQLATHAAAAARRICQEGSTASLHDFRLWAAYEDSRKFILLGDPAARLNL